MVGLLAGKCSLRQRVGGVKAEGSGATMVRSLLRALDGLHATKV